MAEFEIVDLSDDAALRSENDRLRKRVEWLEEEKRQLTVAVEALSERVSICHAFHTGD